MQHGLHAYTTLSRTGHMTTVSNLISARRPLRRQHTERRQPANHPPLLALDICAHWLAQHPCAAVVPYCLAMELTATATATKPAQQACTRPAKGKNVLNGRVATNESPPQPKIVTICPLQSQENKGTTNNVNVQTAQWGDQQLHHGMHSCWGGLVYSLQNLAKFRTSQRPGISARLLIGHLWMRIGAGVVGVDPPYWLLLKVQADS